ncbi:MAG: LEM-3-like GIY-YIG domain-containing protein [Candidatus Dormibacteria bacterium]
MSEGSATPSRSGAPAAEALVFGTGVAEMLKSYVYLLIDPRTNLLFYVGKGKGDRAYAHAVAALGGLDQATRGHLKMGTIREIHRSGRMVRIEILHHGMTDDEAFLVESASIDLVRHLGTVADGGTAATLANVHRGHDSRFGIATVEDLAARYAARQVVIRDPLILIRPSNLWWGAKDDHERYEATRKWWKASASSRARVTHAAAVVDGIVRMVWKIATWEDDAANGRAAFTGSRDPELEARYVWGDVSAVLPLGAQNPIRYVFPKPVGLAGANLRQR